MTSKSFFHADCGESLSLWGGFVYCARCGHLPLNVNPEIDSTEITDFLPYLIEAGIIAESDFHGIALKQI